MSNSIEKYLKLAFVKVLTPLVRIAVRKGIACKAVIEIVKWVFVQVVASESQIPNRKQSVSRICIVTGLTRKDVQNNLAIEIDADEELIRNMNRAKRVITAWMSVKGFQDKQGNPLVLPVEGEKKSFKELVKLSSGDMPVRAMIDELLRLGNVEYLKDDKLKLLTRGYVPTNGEDEKLKLLGENVYSLISTIDKNIYGEAPGSNFHKRVVYENMPSEDLPELKKLIGKKGQKLVEEVNDWMAEKNDDEDKKLSNGGKHNRAGVVVYYFHDDEENEKI